jgi:translocator protein
MGTLRLLGWLVFWAAVVFGTALVGSLFTRQGIPEWFATLHKPAFNPPSWVFGPVWAVLYVLMAVAMWLVWRKAGTSGVTVATVLFVTQLALNVLWPAIFFALRRPGAAFVEIIVLWCAILATTIAFWIIRPLAGLLLVPYQLWVTFAAILNFAIWRTNG